MARVCERCSYENGAEAKFCRDCGAMLELEFNDPDNPLLGKIVLGRYRVTQLIGEGGMGKVYLAEQKMGNAVRKVAIKTLHAQYNRDPQLVARFHRECETVIELTHPNTVKFYDFGELEDSTLVLVMEYIQGESLAEILDRGPIAAERVERILIQICGSLQEAHNCGIVHRDLKPENILLTSRGGQQDFVKVLDFGIAKRSEAEDEANQKLTQQGTVLGTPPYMSPEQFSGKTLDPRSDLYSLGTILFESITGRLPFDANSPWEWATKHLTAPPMSLASFPEGKLLEANRQQAVMGCLAKDPNQRPASALALMQAFTGATNAASAWTYATASGMTPAAGVSQAPSAPVSGGFTPPPEGAPAPGFGTAPGPAQPGPPAAGTRPPSSAHSAHGHRPVPKTTPLQLQAAQSGTSLPAPTPSGGFPEVHAPLASEGKGTKTLLPWAALGVFCFLGVGAGVGYVIWDGQQEGGTADSGVVAQAATDGAVGVTPTLPLAGDAIVSELDTTHIQNGVDGDARGAEQRGAPDAEVARQDESTEEDGANERADRRDGPSASEVRRARQMLDRAGNAIGAQSVPGAAREIVAARRILGAQDPRVRRLQASLSQLGYNLVGREITLGNCASARRIYAALRSARAHRASRTHSSPACVLR